MSIPRGFHQRAGGNSERIRKDLKNERERISRAQMKFQFDTLAEMLQLNRFTRLQKGAILEETIKAYRNMRQENDYLKSENSRLSVELSKVTASLRNVHLHSGGAGSMLLGGTVGSSGGADSMLGGTVASSGGADVESSFSGDIDSNIQMESTMIKSEPQTQQTATQNAEPESGIMGLIAGNTSPTPPGTPNTPLSCTTQTTSHLHPSSALSVQATMHRSVSAIQSESTKIARPKSPKRNRNGDLLAQQSQLTKQLDTNPFDLTDLRRASDEITLSNRNQRPQFSKTIQHLNTGDANSDSELSDTLQNARAKRHQAQRTEQFLRHRSNSGTAKFLKQQSDLFGTSEKPHFQSTVVSTMTEAELENSLDLSCMKLRRSVSDTFMTGLNSNSLPLFYENTRTTNDGQQNSNFYENTIFRGCRGNSIGPIKMSITPRGSVDSLGGLTGFGDPFEQNIKMESEDLLLNTPEKSSKSPSSILVEECMSSPWSPDCEESLLSHSV